MARAVRKSTIYSAIFLSISDAVWNTGAAVALLALLGCRAALWGRLVLRASLGAAPFGDARGSQKQIDVAAGRRKKLGTGAARDATRGNRGARKTSPASEATSRPLRVRCRALPAPITCSSAAECAFIRSARARQRAAQRGRESSSAAVGCAAASALPPEIAPVLATVVAISRSRISNRFTIF